MTTPRLTADQLIKSIILRGIYFTLLLLSHPCKSQIVKSWDFDFAIRATIDAEGYHVGPSLAFGTRKQFSDRVSGSLAYTFFKHPMTGTPDFKFVIHTVDITPEYHLSMFRSNGFFTGIGIALQVRTDEYYGYENMTNVMPSFVFGYDFQPTLLNRQRNMAIELKTFGPLLYENGAEIFTQVMLGLRIKLWRINL